MFTILEYSSPPSRNPHFSSVQHFPSPSAQTLHAACDFCREKKVILPPTYNSLALGNRYFSSRSNVVARKEAVLGVVSKGEFAHTKRRRRKRTGNGSGGKSPITGDQAKTGFVSCRRLQHLLGIAPDVASKTSVPRANRCRMKALNSCS